MIFRVSAHLNVKSTFKLINFCVLGITLSSCASGVIGKADDKYIITYFMTKNDVLEILGKPDTTIEIKGSDAYKKEGCTGNNLEILQYQSERADKFSLMVINEQGLVCKKLYKTQKAVWN